LALGWILYAEDNNGRLVYNVGEAAMNSLEPNWVNCVMSYNGYPATNSDLMIKGLLGPFVGNNKGVFKCPSDQSTANPGGIASPRVRSMSMCTRIGYNPTATKNFTKLSDITNPGPSMKWLTIDEQPDSINDGAFLVDKTDWIDFPAIYHGGSSGISFVDGHSEIHKWRDASTRVAITRGSKPARRPAPGVDGDWIRARTFSPAELGL
jgi:prepilin-type processing-associated H-X9-DG protein